MKYQDLLAIMRVFIPNIYICKPLLMRNESSQLSFFYSKTAKILIRH